MRPVRASATRAVLVGYGDAQDLRIGGPVGCAGGAILCDTRRSARNETTGLLPGPSGTARSGARRARP